LLGYSGAGKSHLLIGIGTAIALAGLQVRYATPVQLANEPAEATGEKQLGRTRAKYAKVDSLGLDEFGYVNLDKIDCKLMSQIFTAKKELRSIALASIDGGTQPCRLAMCAAQEVRRLTAIRYAAACFPLLSGRTPTSP